MAAKNSRHCQLDVFDLMDEMASFIMENQASGHDAEVQEIIAMLAPILTGVASVFSPELIGLSSIIE